MAFWGVEIKAGKSFTHEFDEELGRLHISQATLGLGGSKTRSVVECTVGNKPPILLCALLPGKNESSPLDLEFEEEDKVVLSVTGPRSVHLSGYYLGMQGGECGHEEYGDDESDSDSLDEIAGEDTDSEDLEFGSDDEFLEDLEEDGDDISMFPPGKSGVVIEEIEDDEKPAENGNANNKRPKKSNVADTQKQIVVKDNSSVPMISESEDEDGFPISSGKSEKEVTKEIKKIEDGSIQSAGKKRKNESINQDDSAKKSEESKGSSVQQTDNKPKNKKKKGKKDVAEDDKMVQDVKIVDNADQDNGQGKKKKNKKNKSQETTASASKEVVEKKTPTVVTEDKKEKKASQVRTFPNGLIIEETGMGKPDAKKACNGSMVSMRYIGKLKSNGKIFDSNMNGKPFKFRLGIQQVIKGWDVGVKGMRVGDKRRLTIPPSMGYGAQGAPPAIPQNAWLVFDVELVDVRN